MSHSTNTDPEKTAMSTTKTKTFKLQHNDETIGIDERGRIVSLIDYHTGTQQEIEFSASELDLIARFAAVAVVYGELQQRVAKLSTADSGYNVTVEHDGDNYYLEIGCYNVSMKEVAAIHKISLAQRAKKRK